jgi:hypothetical protein
VSTPERDHVVMLVRNAVKQCETASEVAGRLKLDGVVERCEWAKEFLLDAAIEAEGRRDP